MATPVHPFDGEATEDAQGQLQGPPTGLALAGPALAGSKEKTLLSTEFDVKGIVIPGPKPDTDHVRSQHRSSFMQIIDATKHRSTRIKGQTTHAYGGDIVFKRESWVNAYIMHPSHPGMRRWDLYIAVLLIYTAYVTPFEVAFLETKFDAMFLINQVVNISFLLDMVKTFFTAYLDRDTDQLHGDINQIAIKYLKTWLVVDLASILPFDSVGLATGSEQLQRAKGARIIRLLRLLKLLRLLRSVRIFDRYQDSFGMTFAFRKLVTFGIIIVTSMHWFAIVLRLLPLFGELTTSDPSEQCEECSRIENPAAISWMTVYKSGGVPLVDCDSDIQYAWAIYWSSMTLTTIGYGDISATNVAESIWMTVAMIMGSGLYAYAIGEVCGIVANMDEATTDYNRRSDMLNHFCREHNLPPTLAVRLREYFRVGKHIMRANYFKGILQYMSPKLRAEVTSFLNYETMQRVPFFNIDDEDEYNRFVSQITQVMEATLFASKEAIILFGDRMKGMHIVVKGVAFGGGSIGAQGKWQIYSTGNIFATEALLLRRRHMYDVRALKLLETNFISRSSLQKILRNGDFKKITRSIRKAAIKAIFVLSFPRFMERLHHKGVKLKDFAPSEQERLYIRDGMLGVERNFNKLSLEEEDISMVRVAQDIQAILAKTEQIEERQNSEFAAIRKELDELRSTTK